MCGIVGIARRSNGPGVHPSEISRMCDAIYHRGPDDQGAHVRGHVGLGMRRLSIIDLAGGHQPIYNEDETIVIVFNGEIYNYRELRQHLLSRGHTLKTNSDTETIVHLYEEYGADCVKHLRGMFGFALWDERKRVLLVARDRFGIKPMYIAADQDQVAFASELKALIAAGAVDGTLDWGAMEAFFRLGYIPAPYSPYAGVRKLEPGHLMLWQEDGSLEIRQYWDVPVHETESVGTVDDVLGWIDESVAAHLVSDVPLAVMLSGGLDSSAVFASMAQAGPTPHAFTARYTGSGASDADETGLAKQLADKYGAKLTVVDIEPNVTDLLPQMMYTLDEPHADESAIPTWLLSKAVASEYKVALAGTGGDELFGGYRRHYGLLASEWYTGLPASARAVARTLVSSIPEPRSGGLSVHRLKRFVRTSPGSVADRYFDMLNKMPDVANASLFSADIAPQITGSPAADHLRQVYRAGGAPRGLKAALYMDYKTYLPDDILHLSDRIAMAHSLEVRVPLVDHVLVERALPLVDRMKPSRKQFKPLLRKAIAQRLPAAHMTAKKRGFVGPTAAWLRNELREMLMDELSPSRINQLGFFNSKVVASLIDDHMSRRHNRESVLWALLSFSVWHRVFIEQRAAASVPEISTAVAL